MDEDFKKCMDFIIEIDKLKSIFRRSQLINSDRFENDAEHSWHICVMAYTLYPFFSEEGGNERPNLCRAVKMLLLHDIVEVYAGDTYCYDIDARSDKYERELMAAHKIFGLLPKDICSEFKLLWLEFDKEESADAVFAATMDKLQPLLLNFKNNGRPWIENGIKKSQVLKRMEIINKSSPILRNYVLDIIEDAVRNGWLLDE